MSETAFFVKDVIGPKGCVSITDEQGLDRSDDSQDIDSHSKTGMLKLHHSETGSDGNYLKKDEFISAAGEPDHDGLCQLEQEYFLNAIKNDVDLTDHMQDAVKSLAIVLAADESFKTGKTVEL